jgi:hypothetical protein
MSNNLSSHFIRSRALVGLAVACTGCALETAPPESRGSPADSPEASTANVVADGASAFDLLHTERLSDGNTVEFHELRVEPGFILVVETGTVPNRPHLSAAGRGSVLQAFRTVRPDQPVPDALARAQARQDRLRESGAMAGISVAPGKTVRLDDSGVGAAVPGDMLRHRGHCPADWFRRNVCDRFMTCVPHYQWRWTDRNSATERRIDNIPWYFQSAVCVDQGQVRYELEVRRSTIWRATFSRAVDEGNWWTYYWDCRNNNHDFKSRVTEVGLGDWYHTCGGGNDESRFEPTRASCPGLP